ncbi:MAG: cobalt-precorrin 5A hydrolase [Clostridiales bacterium]|nr:cobalt-precorrin 5A hydrolase [Clostridiales bacterium]
MRLAVIGFTRAGARLCGQLVKQFGEQGEDCRGYVRERFLKEAKGTPGVVSSDVPVTEWTGQVFGKVDGLIYIGAAGIAVRAIAPWLKDKMTDPAVLCVDEQGHFAISLLSGHVGGANALARRTAGMVGAVPVVTTASDAQGLLAVDEWAKAHGLSIADREEAKRTAAALVNGEAVGFYSDFAIEDGIPEGYTSGQMCRRNVWVTAGLRPDSGSWIAMFLRENAAFLRLVPRVLTVGIGCRRGTACAGIESAVRQTLESNNLDMRAIRSVASIDLKREEAGMVEFARNIGVPYHTFPAAILADAEGEFTESDFVRQVTGCGSVCERAAVIGCGAVCADALLVRKTVHGGVTVAVAVEDAVVIRKKEQFRKADVD